MYAESPETEQLIDQVAKGDESARQALFTRHRERLRQMVAVRLDDRLARRLDPSDIVQDALAEAHRTMDEYLKQRPLPFYPWLRRLAWERLIQVHRQHVEAGKRSLLHERRGDLDLTGRSALLLADRLIAGGTSPSRHAIREELQDRVRVALGKMNPRDGEVLVLRFLEQLSTAEAAAVLGIGEAAVSSRLVRALARFQTLLEGGAAAEDWR
jgi:RNA polymerase sigma-70 factor (ECF subfamily)